MMDFTVLDYLYIFVAIASTAWAFARGGVYELVATVSWLAAAVASRFVSPWLNGAFQGLFGLDETTITTLVAAYFVVFFGVLVAFGLVNQKLRDWVQDSILQITDRTLGVIFGILRAVIIMGFVYWGFLWYYDNVEKPEFLTKARTRPMMQLTAVKLDEWFVPGESKLLEEDMTGARAAEELFMNLIDPAIRAAQAAPVISQADNAAEPQKDEGTGYRESERNALENQLLQLGNIPDFDAIAEQDVGEEYEGLEDVLIRYTE